MSGISSDPTSSPSTTTSNVSRRTSAPIALCVSFSVVDIVDLPSSLRCVSPGARRRNTTGFGRQRVPVTSRSLSDIAATTAPGEQVHDQPRYSRPTVPRLATSNTNGTRYPHRIVPLRRRWATVFMADPRERQRSLSLWRLTRPHPCTTPS